MKISIDFETYSEADLLDVGTQVYCEHPSTEVYCAAWAVEDEEPRLWWAGEKLPEEWLRKDAVFHAWNAPFEMAIISHVLERCTPSNRMPSTNPAKWRCTMAAALRYALPGDLDKCARALNLAHQKDKVGRRVMLKHAKPRKPTKKDPSTRHAMTEEDRIALGDYCLDDVRTERGIADAIDPLPPEAQADWVATYEMNRRGIYVDIEGCVGAERINYELARRNELKLATVTDRYVTSGNQTKRMREWAADQGYFMLDVTADTIDAVIADKDAPPKVREMARLRSSLSKTSASKYGKMVRVADSKRLIKGALQWHGASTGRDAGRLHQAQNFARPSEGFEDASDADLDALAGTLAAGDLDVLSLMYGDPEIALKDGLRPMMRSRPGRRLIAADLAGIENRVLAAFAGEEWKIEAFKEIDAGIGRDMYCRSADMVFGYEVNKKEHPTERQVGKVLELSMGYQGGVGAWRNFDKSDRYNDEEIHEFKRAWRAKHPNTVNFWYALENAAIEAVLTGRPVETHNVVFELSPDGNWLVCCLPSERWLWYNAPEISMEPGFRGDLEPKLSCMRYRKGQWQRVGMYGGMWAENVVQGSSYDIVMRGFRLAVRAGYFVILRIHDELVSDMPYGHGTVAELVSLMTDADPWVKRMDIPLAAAGWEGERFRK